MFCPPNTTNFSRVPKQTINVSLFFTEPKWLNDVKMFLQIGHGIIVDNKPKAMVGQKG
jgi:hypothetical protein